jgi:hypothetical protein
MDVETLRGLLIANGGGAVALLAALSGTLDRPGYEPLAYAMLVGIVVFMFGVVLAILFNYFRRQCLQQQDQLVLQTPPPKVLGLKLRAPGACIVCQACLYLALLCFIGTGAYVAIAGTSMLGATPVSSVKQGPGVPKAGTTKSR